MEKKNLGTINGEEIRSFTLYGDETGDSGDFTSLKELYERMQELKKYDRGYYGYCDSYTVQINTDTTCYTNYKLSKYKNRYKLK